MTASQPPPAAPVAPKIPVVSTLHGERRVDDYFWMRDKANPQVAAYLEAENRYTATVLAPLEGLRETLYGEMLGRIKETDVQVPWRKGGYFYYSRTEEGQQYPIHCRRRSSLEAAEEVTLDLNRLADGKSFLVARNLRSLRWRPPARLLHRRHRLPPVHAVRP